MEFILISVLTVTTFPYINGQFSFNGAYISPERPPIAFYRRNSMTHDKETIGSLGGAQVGVYRRRQLAPDYHSLSAHSEEFKPRFIDRRIEVAPANNHLNFYFEFKNNSRPNSNSSEESITISNVQSPIQKIIMNILNTQKENNLKQKLASFGLGISLGTMLGTLIPK